MAENVPIGVPDRTDHLRDILTGDALFESERTANWRLSELRDHWDGSEEALSVALVKLVENGEIALFPVGDVTKIKRENL